MYFAGWLWQIVDIRWLERKMGQVNAEEKLRQEMEPRTTQHQILVMVFWLGAMTGFLYILIH